jgi:DNA-binding winged helix-turn-helix (wHTH) protein
VTTDGYADFRPPPDNRCCGQTAHESWQSTNQLDRRDGSEIEEKDIAMRAHDISRDTPDRTNPALIGADSTIPQPRSASIHLLNSSTRSGRHRSVAPSTPMRPNSQNEMAELLADVDGLPILVRFRVQDIPAQMQSEYLSRRVDIHSLLSSTLEKMVDRMGGSCRRTDGPSRQPVAIVEVIPSGKPVVWLAVPENQTVLQVGPLELDLLDRTAKRGDREIDLRPREFRLLKYMMQRSEQLLTRETLLKEVWNYKFVPETNLVDVHLGRLRRKIDGPNEAPMIRNVRGAGFVLSADPLLQDAPPARLAAPAVG